MSKKALNSILAIFFDLDNTLIQTRKADLKTVKEVSEIFIFPNFFFSILFHHNWRDISDTYTICWIHHDIQIEIEKGKKSIVIEKFNCDLMQKVKLLWNTLTKLEGISKLFFILLWFNLCLQFPALFCLVETHMVLLALYVTTTYQGRHHYKKKM